jgi:hypothetical protein
MSEHPVPAPVVRARRLAGVLLVLSVAIAMVMVILALNWYFTRPVAL